MYVYMYMYIEESQFWDDQLNSEGEEISSKYGVSSSESESDRFDDLSTSSPSDSVGFQDYSSQEMNSDSEGNEISVSRSQSTMHSRSKPTKSVSKLLRLQQGKGLSLQAGDATSKRSVRYLRKQSAMVTGLG